jgi:tetratricopeptide (TPR) repeat protein
MIPAALLLAQGQARSVALDITPGELALTPAFCQDVQTINGWSQHSRPSPRSPHWLGLMGETFWGMHHYCWALIHLQRADRAGTSPQQREFLIREAISDFYFVINIAPPEFPLLPELYFRTGEGFLLLGEYARALDELQKSRRSKAAYWPPYVSEANLLLKLGKRKEAMELIDQGLKVMPDEPNLLKFVNRAKDVRPREKVSSRP